MAKIYISFLFFSLFLIHSNSLLFQDNLLTKLIEKEKYNNLMISPFSIYQFLSLLANGATGKTRNEVLQAFFPNKVIDKDTDTDALLNTINLNMKEIMLNIELEDVGCPEGEDCKINLRDINTLFIKSYVKLEDKFTKVCEIYNTSYFELMSVEQINKYVYEQTNGKIDNVITLLPPDVSLVLANIIYFKGAWVNEFSETDTQKKEFLNNDKTTVLIDTMNQDIFTEYYEDDKVQIISLPYKSHNLDFNMIIILPNLEKYSTPSDYLNKEKISLSEIPSKLTNHESINLYLPKFKFNYSSLLRDLLTKIGIKSLYNSGEYDNLSKNTYIYLDDINHLTYIDVNENGTESAAVTIMYFNSTKMLPEKTMNINHSFIYMIQSNKIKDSEGNYLMPFIGIVNNLNEKGSIDNNSNDKSIDNNNPTDIKNENIKTDENIKSDENINNDSIISGDNDDGDDDETVKFVPFQTNANKYKINLTIIIYLLIILFF